MAFVDAALSPLLNKFLIWVKVYFSFFSPWKNLLSFLTATLNLHILGEVVVSILVSRHSFSQELLTFSLPWVLVVRISSDERFSPSVVNAWKKPSFLLSVRLFAKLVDVLYAFLQEGYTLFGSDSVLYVFKRRLLHRRRLEMIWLQKSIVVINSYP